MWDQKLLELFTTIIPQSFAIILLFFSLVGIKIEKKSFSLFSIAYSIVIFLIRPYVNFGVHTVIMLFIVVIVATQWGKASIISSVIYSVVTFIVAYVCEWLTFFFLEMSKFNMELLDTNTQIRVMIGFIPLCALFAVGLTVYYTKMGIKKKEINKNVV